jgi:diguanylate cyclase (GGDEF)-like protein
LSRLLHHDLSLVAGQPFEDLVHAKDRPLVRDAMLGSERTEHLEANIERPDGELVTLALSVTDLRSDPLVQGFVVSGTDITDLKTTQQALRHMADHDGLTGLLSRRALLAKLDHFVDDGYQHEIVLLFCDLDGFKAVNDRIGHAAGDQVLIEVARRLERALRPQDLVGRLGGDEFVVVLPRADRSTQDEITTRIKSSLAEPIFAGDELVEVGVSIGSASTGDHPTAGRLLTTADDAMYEVKRARHS